jgi:PDZ domain
MEIERESPVMKPSPQPAGGPMPAPAPGPRLRSAPATSRIRTGVLVFGLLLAASVGIGAVTTGLVHVPGFNTETSAPAPAMSQGDVTDETDASSKTMGAGLDSLTPGYVKSHKLATRQTGGYVVTYIMPRSPAEDAKLQINDIVVAIDGVPIGENYEAWNSKTRMTPFGSHMRLTIERNGALQEVPIAVGRCSLPSEQRQPHTLCPSQFIVK